MRAKRRKKRIWVRKHSAKDIGKLVCIINATTSMAMECCHIHKFMPSVEYSYMFLNVECDAHKTRHAWKRWKISEKNIICSSYTIDKLWLLAINRIRSWQSTFHLIHTLLRRSFFSSMLHSSFLTFSERCLVFHLLHVYCISFFSLVKLLTHHMPDFIICQFCVSASLKDAHTWLVNLSPCFFLSTNFVRQ